MNERSQWNEMEPKWSQRRHVFGCNIVLYVISNNEDHKFKSIKDYKKGKYLQMEKRQFQWNQTLWTCSPHTRRCEVKCIYMIFPTKMKLEL